VIDVQKNALAPKAFSNLVTRYEFAPPLEQEDQQFHGEFFQAQTARTPLQAIAASVERELAEMENLGRGFTSPSGELCR